MNVLFGITLKIVSALAFALMGAQIKLVNDVVPTGQVMFFRSFLALVPLLIWLAWRGELIDAVRTHNPLGHVKRSLVGAVGMFLGFAALSRLSLPDATAIGFVSPLMAIVLAAVLLKEKVGRHSWVALAFGFVGMIVMMWPYLGQSRAGSAVTAGALLGFAAACFNALASTEVRRLAMVERTGAIVFYFSAITALFGLATIVAGWHMPSGREAFFLVGAGIMGGIGQILMTASMRHAPLSVLVPLDYMSLLWATILGYLVFGAVPTILVVVGAAIVMGAAIVVIATERRNAHRTPRPAAGSGPRD